MGAKSCKCLDSKSALPVEEICKWMLDCPLQWLFLAHLCGCAGCSRLRRHYSPLDANSFFFLEQKYKSWVQRPQQNLLNWNCLEYLSVGRLLKQWQQLHSSKRRGDEAKENMYLFCGNVFFFCSKSVCFVSNTAWLRCW